MVVRSVRLRCIGYSTPRHSVEPYIIWEEGRRSETRVRAKIHPPFFKQPGGVCGGNSDQQLGETSRAPPFPHKADSGWLAENVDLIV